MRARSGLGLMGLALAACATTPAPTPPPPAPATSAVPSPQMQGWSRIAPACKLDGCCSGHGEVAYLQPDRYIMCTDGSVSQICDCH